MDDEYRQAVTGAELAWVEGVIADLRSGSWTWSYEQLVPFLQADSEAITDLLV